ncbi:AAEL000821-PA [Aedes aegypti]|uniref:AAEL000821-PA n=1 Tax=Aedes aegypti TaxID=7159 RepID=Q17N18_AEDAE|nr:AAEL000821-PA [Aedes aegypti]
MKRLASLLLLFLTVRAEVSTQHCAVAKLPCTLHSECLQYLNSNDDGPENCAYRCIALTARFWDDQKADVIRTISRFYLTDANDDDFRNRTEQCLQETQETFPVTESCQRASCAFSCYNDQFGEVIAVRPSFIPFTALEHRRIVRECVDILQIGPQSRQAILDEGLMEVPEGRCLLRCVLLREGLYNDWRGPRLGSLWVQTEGYEDRFFDTAQKCYPLLKMQTLEPCELAARFAAECLPSRVPFVETVFAALASNQ